MKNNEIMTLNIKRIDVIDIKMAIRSIIFDFEDEIRNPETGEYRKQVIRDSIDHRWQPLLDSICEQFEAQDKQG